MIALTAASASPAALAQQPAIPPSSRRAHVPPGQAEEHAGVGAMLSDGRWGVGFEVRGLVRGGVGNQDDPTAHAMSSFRAGFEGRAPVIYISFP